LDIQVIGALSSVGNGTSAKAAEHVAGPHHVGKSDAKSPDTVSAVPSCDPGCEQARWIHARREGLLVPGGADEIDVMVEWAQIVGGALVAHEIIDRERPDHQRWRRFRQADAGRRLRPGLLSRASSAADLSLDHGEDGFGGELAVGAPVLGDHCDEGEPAITGALLLVHVSDVRSRPRPGMTRSLRRSRGIVLRSSRYASRDGSA
jgi:hypothetical protein